MKIKLRNFIDKRNLYLLMMPVFFLFHGYNESFGLIPLTVLLRLSLEYIFITALAIVFSQLLIRDTIKAGVFAFCLLYVYFFFGAFYDFLKSHLKNASFLRYSIILPLIFIVVVVFFIIIRRAGRSLVHIRRYMIILLTLFIGLEVITLVYKLVNNEFDLNNLADSQISSLQIQQNCSKPKPDIFFVVFDGYTNSQCLKNEFNYENFEIDSLLKANNFYTSIASMSNYNVTPFSLSSTFYMQYLRAGLEKEIVSSKVFLQAIETLKNSSVAKFLKNQNYVIKNLGCFDFEDTPAETKPYFDGLNYSQIDNQTFLSRIKRDIGFNWMIRDVFTGKPKISLSYKQAKQYHLFRNRYNYNELMSELSSESDKPRFVYVHLMLPHEPFYLDSSGVPVSDTAIILQTQNMKKGYLNQIKYANLLLKKLIPLAAHKSDRERVVIIEGDHGFRDYNDSSKINNDFKNLNTYYFSDHDYRLLKENISPVNSFRVVLDKYFCQSLPLLKDSSIYLINNLNRLH